MTRSDLCLTAELTAERPDNLSQRATSAQICLGEDPIVLLEEGQATLFTMYPCVGVTDYPCSSDDDPPNAGGWRNRRQGGRNNT